MLILHIFILINCDFQLQVSPINFLQEYWCGKTNSEATKRTPNLQYEFVYIKHTVANVFCWYICKKYDTTLYTTCKPSLL